MRCTNFCVFLSNKLPLVLKRSQSQALGSATFVSSPHWFAYVYAAVHAGVSLSRRYNLKTAGAKNLGSSSMMECSCYVTRLYTEPRYYLLTIYLCKSLRRCVSRRSHSKWIRCRSHMARRNQFPFMAHNQLSLRRADQIQTNAREMHNKFCL